MTRVLNPARTDPEGFIHMQKVNPPPISKSRISFINLATRGVERSSIGDDEDPDVEEIPAFVQLEAARGQIASRTRSTTKETPHKNPARKSRGVEKGGTSAKKPRKGR